MKYSLTEIFSSLQGEGYWTGTPVTFIRFSGCNMNCSFCDTDHRVRFFARADEVMEKVAEQGMRRVVLTGGEPLLQIKTENDPLLKCLKAASYSIHLETNGTIPLPVRPVSLFDWVTVSPKGKQVITAGNELKVVYMDGVDLQTYEKNTQFDWYFVQPMWQHDGSCRPEKAVQAVMENPKWRLSLQTHKYLNIV